MREASRWGKVSVSRCVVVAFDVVDVRERRLRLLLATRIRRKRPRGPKSTRKTQQSPNSTINQSEMMLPILLITLLAMVGLLFTYWYHHVDNYRHRHFAKRFELMEKQAINNERQLLRSRLAVFAIAVGDEARRSASSLLRSLHRNAPHDYAVAVVVADGDVVVDDVAGIPPTIFVDVESLPFELPTVLRPKRDDGSRLSERRAHKLAIKSLKTKIFA
jgi:hypothetical protein